MCWILLFWPYTSFVTGTHKPTSSSASLGEVERWQACHVLSYSSLIPTLIGKLGLWTVLCCAQDTIVGHGRARLAELLGACRNLVLPCSYPYSQETQEGQSEGVDGLDQLPRPCPASPCVPHSLRAQTLGSLCNWSISKGETEAGLLSLWLVFWREAGPEGPAVWVSG